MTRGYWKLIATIKHPVMEGREAEVQSTLSSPDAIRRSRANPAVYLFYRLEHPGRWTCAVAKQLNHDGFLITAYLTDAIKEGEQLWTR